ncbi:MAG: (Fe-S)-binding protein [Thermofilum sp.]|uniref:(Fe-S)-binding protein n=1 Tax=Thermofilum pendens TaxID=2269 RepID=A0A7C4H6J4_THEPE
MSNTAQAFLQNFERKLNRSLKYYLDICARCGACSDACHMYVATRDPVHAPAYRMELIRRLYKSAHSPLRMFPRLIGADGVDEKFIQDLSRAVWECTGCRRCVAHCPFGIDVTVFFTAAKPALVAAGVNSPAPEIYSMVADAALERGRNVELYKGLFLEQVKSLEDQLRAETGDPTIEIPVGKKGARVLYVALAGSHTILPAAKIFHAAREDWTLSVFDAANYAFFLADTEKAKEIARNIVEEAKSLGVKVVVITECGHAYRVMKHLAPKWLGEEFPFEVKSIVEIIDEYIREGRIKLRKEAIKEPVTYHDPCQLARNGGVIEEPRRVLKAAVLDFREMTPNGEKNWCCGGGGGLVAVPDFEELRVKTGKKKAEQVRATGARIVATACENCKAQLKLLSERYNLGVQVVGVMDLVAEALSFS